LPNIVKGSVPPGYKMIFDGEVSEADLIWNSINGRWDAVVLPDPVVGWQMRPMQVSEIGTNVSNYVAVARKR
jgi:hypothetical protein